LLKGIARSAWMVLKEFLLAPQSNCDLRGVDVVFRDSLAMVVVRSRRKIHYRLIAMESIDALAFTLSALQDYGWKKRMRRLGQR
jgi:hypothetical protein